MGTWRQDHAEELKDRPYMGRPTWELRNMAKALSYFPWLNDGPAEERLREAKRELKLRRKK